MKRLAGSVVAVGLIVGACTSAASRESAPSTSTSTEKTASRETTFRNVAKNAGKLSVRGQNPKPAANPTQAKVENPVPTTSSLPEETPLETPGESVRAAMAQLNKEPVNAVVNELIIPQLSKFGLHMVLEYESEVDGVPFGTITVSTDSPDNACANTYAIESVAGNPNGVEISMGLIGYIDDLKAISENDGNWTEYGGKVGHAEGSLVEVKSVNLRDEASLNDAFTRLADDSRTACNNFVQSQTNP